MDFTTKIKDHKLEYIDESHTYKVDGVVVPSITTLLKLKFGGTYSAVDDEVLEKARLHGVAVHEAIEEYCVFGLESDLKEVKNFKFLQKHYGFTVASNEVPVILFNEDGKPIAAGRLDLVLEMDGELGGADVKSVATLNKEYLAWQLNLYRIAYRQSYGKEWTFLKGIQLKDDKRKFVSIPINEQLITEWIKEEINESI